MDRNSVCQTVSRVLGSSKRKHQDWFDEHDKCLQNVLATRNTGRKKMLHCNRRLKKKRCLYSQKYTRGMKFNWWEEKAGVLQTAADARDMKIFFTGLREIYGPKTTRANSHNHSRWQDIVTGERQDLSNICRPLLSAIEQPWRCC